VSALDYDTIQKLLAGEQTEEDKAHIKPIQIGPLRWFDETDRCASRGCSSPTRIRVVGVPYCNTHALYALNRLLIDNGVNTADCVCNAGKYSMMNIHTQDCPIFIRVKEQRDSIKSDSSA